MPFRSPARHPRPLASVVAAALLVLGAVVGGAVVASPASAHDELVSTDPAAGATLDAIPAQLTLTFSGELLADPGATEVQITDAAGTALASGAPAVDGTVVTQAIDAAAAPGAVTVLWRVVSSDGHPISGELDFTVAAAAPVSSPSTTPSGAGSPSPSASAAATADVGVAPSASASAVDAAGDATGATPWPWIVGGIVLVAAGGALVAVLIGRARGGSTSGR